MSFSSWTPTKLVISIKLPENYLFFNDNALQVCWDCHQNRRNNKRQNRIQYQLDISDMHVIGRIDQISGVKEGCEQQWEGGLLHSSVSIRGHVVTPHQRSHTTWRWSGIVVLLHSAVGKIGKFAGN